MPCPASRRRGLPVGVVICAVALAAPVAAIEPPPVVFEGLGLAGFEGAGSVASALKQAGPAAPDAAPSPVEFKGIAVQGPTGRDGLPVPLAAELRSRIDQFDVAAGLLADPAVIDAGPARWTGRIGLANTSDAGRESLELRTMLAPGQERSTIGLALGPRLERRFGKGMTFFLDGQAEAQAMRSAEAGWWTLPGTSTADLTMLGVTATTGLLR
ncbi:MAG: hypothetical protein ACKOCX_12795 [Planctomycetota bacterium]